MTRNCAFNPHVFPYVENRDIQVDFSAIYYFSQYIDRNLLEELMKNYIVATRTVMERYIPAETDIPAILAGPSGSHHLSVKGDKKNTSLNWMDIKESE